MRVLIILVALVVLAQSKCPFNNGQKIGGKIHCPHNLKEEIAREVTAQGCTCKTDCGASIHDGYNCDWCYTQDGCGMRGLTGSYDYCVWPSVAAYENLTWDQKQSGLWTQVTADETSADIANPLTMLVESIQDTFHVNADVMPKGRKKVIHGVGAVCKFNMEISKNSPYTGVFAAGTTAHGLIRMGSALSVDKESGVVPGVGIKFLRTGVQSGNYVALYTLGALPDNNYNFFEKTISNHIPGSPQGAKEKVLITKFQQSSNCVTMVGLSDICKYGTDGKSVASPKFPFQVTMDSKQIQFPSTPVMQDQLQTQLAAIPSGTPLYEVGYYNSPKDFKNGEKPVVLGTMVTDGPCVNSKFGDESLFFRHQPMEEDFALEPTWPGYLDPNEDCASKIKPSGTLPKQCAGSKFEEAMKLVPSVW